MNPSSHSHARPAFRARASAATTLALLVSLLACGCREVGVALTTDGGGPDQSASVVCQPCLTSSDCGAGSACVQYGADDFCGQSCTKDADCASGQACTPSTGFDGKETLVCVPKDGACPPMIGCGTCAAGTACDVTTGTCAPIATSALDGGTCGTFLSPSTSATCCHSCTPGKGTCQPNGCYGGWWCDSSSCHCHASPSSCGGATTGGTSGGGLPDGGIVVGDPSGSVGIDGGTVTQLYFAVVGDTRPANEDDTANYPTTIITKIYADIEAMSPRPQFVVTTGDYMFANASGAEAEPQMALYMGARAQYTGPVFAALGNHECTGFTSSNCASLATTNFKSFMSNLIAPLGQSLPYYTISINGPDQAGVPAFTSKLIIAACNAWDAKQKAWLDGELKRPTTYTFVVRHEPAGTAQAPCVAEMDAMLAQSPYDLFIVGHSHTFSHSKNQIIVGNGGAPISGSADFGYATIELMPDGTFLAAQYDYMSAMPVSAFTFK